MWIFILALTFPISGRTADEIPDVNMHSLLKEVMVLQKFLFSGPDFSAPANNEQISSSLEAMNSHLEKLSAGTFKSDPALRTNLTLISEHLSKAEDGFRKGEKAYSRYMIQSSLQMCVSCHTRTRSADIVLPDAELKSATPVERADFYFATRQFEKGKEKLEAVVAGFSENDLTPAQLNRVMTALAIYYARVKEDPAGGFSYFRKLSKNQKFPSYLRANLSEWADDFKAWAREPKKLAEDYPLNSILPRARKLLTADRLNLLSDSDSKFDVRRLRASALLYRVLEAPGMVPEKGDALLYLGQIFQKMKYQSFYRLGEMHFKACIKEFPGTNVSRRCYEALEQAFFERYPVDSSDEIELVKLKRMAL